MEYFFSRRQLTPDGKHFTSKPGRKTRFVQIKSLGQPQSPALIVDPRTWAQRVFATTATRDVLIVVHGFNVRQNAFVHELSATRQALQARGFNGAVVGYDWPADGRMSNYPQDWADATETARYLVSDGIAALLRIKPTARIHILAHSMGAWVTSWALHQALNTMMEPRLAQSLGHVLLTAGDTDMTWTAAGAWQSEALRRCADRMTAYWSDLDQVLTFSENNYHPGTLRLGRNGLAVAPSGRLQSVNCGPYYLRRYGPFRPRFSHSWYYQDPVFFRDAVGALQGKTLLPTRATGVDGVHLLKA